MAFDFWRNTNSPSPEVNSLSKDSANEFAESVEETAPSLVSETIAESVVQKPEEKHEATNSSENITAQESAEAFAAPETQPAEEPESPVQEVQEEENYVEYPDYTENFEALQTSLAGLQDIVENLQYNMSILVQNQASAADVAAMRRENEAFRSDSNMKLMRKYGIDAMIKTYQAICDKIFRINHPKLNTQTVEGEKTAYEWVLNRMARQFKQLGIRLQSSETGSEFDESTMTVYGSEGEDIEEEEAILETDVESLKDTVKESVCPAFIWTIPSLIGDAKEWCMEAEKVCIYK
jgi:hypothetical protein